MTSRLLDIRAVVATMSLNESMGLSTISDHHLHLSTLGTGFWVVLNLSALSVVVHEHDVALVDASGVRAAMRSLFVVSSHVSFLSITHANCIAAYILIVRLIEEDIALLLLSISRRGSYATCVVHVVDLSIHTSSTHGINLVGASISNVVFVVCIQLQLFG